MPRSITPCWERIRTYPCHRSGRVSANILLDVRKRYRRHRTFEVPESVYLEHDLIDDDPSVEDEVLSRVFLIELAQAQRQGLMSAQVLDTILRIFQLGDSRCETAAVHGLGHLCHPRGRDFLQTVIDERKSWLDGEALTWLEHCRDGTVM